MNPKCSLPEERRREILGRFDGNLRAEEEDAARSMFPQYLFFRNEYMDDGWNTPSGPVRVCTCTACGRHFEAYRGNYKRGKLHHEKCNCPMCGALVEGIAAGKYGWDMKSLERWVKTAVARPAGDGGLLIEAGFAVRQFNQEDLTGAIWWHPEKRYYFGRDGSQEWKLTNYYEGCHMVGHDWIETKTVRDPFPPNQMGYGDFDGRYSVIGLVDAIRETDFRYCQIEDFYRYGYGAELDENQPARWIVKYLAWYAQHPQIEMAVKFGIEDAVHELISDGKKNARYLKWSGKSPDEFLRMSKQDAKLFLRWGMDWKDLKNWKETGGQTSLRDFREIRERVGGQTQMTELAVCAETAGVGIRQAANYVESLTPQCSRAGVTVETIIGFWKDYLDMARQLHFDLKEKTVAMPKDLKRRHDNASEILRIQANEEELKRYRTRRRRLEKKYQFRLGELCVLVPTGSEEIVREGKTLKHCVGGYAARHVDGKTTILFIRQWKKPGRSLLTVEVYEEKGKTKVRQIHGYRNEGYKGAQKAGEKYAWFLGPWLDWVNSGSERDRDGNPVLPNHETKTEVQSA